jgi:hypothetical protein
MSMATIGPRLKPGIEPFTGDPPGQVPGLRTPTPALGEMPRLLDAIQRLQALDH